MKFSLKSLFGIVLRGARTIIEEQTAGATTKKEERQHLSTSVRLRLAKVAREVNAEKFTLLESDGKLGVIFGPFEICTCTFMIYQKTFRSAAWAKHLKSYL